MSSAVATPVATRTTWAIDPVHSSVEFAVRHLMITTVKGRFTDVQGTVVTDDLNPADGSVEVTIGAASIDTRDAQRDAHLRSADFFDADVHQSLIFRSTALRNISPSGFKLAGDLTIHGVTRPVVLDVASEGRGRDPWGGDRAGFSATGRIKRSEFGLVWNQVLETGGLAVSDDIKIAIDVQLIKKAQQAL